MPVGSSLFGIGVMVINRKWTKEHENGRCLLLVLHSWPFCEDTLAALRKVEANPDPGALEAPVVLEEKMDRERERERAVFFVRY